MIKHTFIFSLLFLLIVSTPASATNDKTLHFVVSTATGYLAESIIHKHTNSDFKRIAYGTLLGTVPGLIKEVADSKEINNTFSGGDMAANFAGAFVGSWVATKVNSRLMVSFKKTNGTYIVGLILWD